MCWALELVGRTRSRKTHTRDYRIVIPAYRSSRKNNKEEAGTQDHNSAQRKGRLVTLCFPRVKGPRKADSVARIQLQIQHLPTNVCGHAEGSSRGRSGSLRKFMKCLLYFLQVGCGSACCFRRVGIRKREEVQYWVEEVTLNK